MFLRPLRQLRKVCTVVALFALLMFIIQHMSNNFRGDDYEIADSARPLPSAREDGPRGFPTNHRHLFHIYDTQSNLPERFRVVNLRSQRKRTKGNFDHLPFNCTTSKSVPSFKICVYSPETDKYISGSLLSSGLWEPHITRAFQTALSRYPHATVIDVGANIGYYSLLASAMGHMVIALEPQEENLKRFIAGACAGHWNDNIMLLANALSDSHRNVSLSQNLDNQGGIRVLEDNCYQRNWDFGADLGEPPNDTQCRVPTLTLDDLLYIVTTRTAIIKVDIEGYECRALGKASQFFSSIKVPYVFMEWRQMRERQHLADTACRPELIRTLSSFFADRGYVPHEIRSGIRLNPYSAGSWRVGDIYWRAGDQDLLVPSL